MAKFPGSSGRASDGSVVVQSFRGRLRLRMPRNLYGGEQKYLSLGMPDTAENWEIAKAKSQLIGFFLTWYAKLTIKMPRTANIYFCSFQNS